MFVIYRINILSTICTGSFITFTFINLFIYFLLIRKTFLVEEKTFTFFQEITKYTLLFAICFLATFILI